jgi:hypothetical protein
MIPEIQSGDYLSCKVDGNYSDLMEFRELHIGLYYI